MGDRQGLEGLFALFQTIFPPTELDIFLHSNNGLFEAGFWFQNHLTLPNLDSLDLAGEDANLISLALPFIRR